MGRPTTNKKNKSFLVRVSEEELAMLDRQAKENGLNRSSYILYLIDREEKAAQLRENLNPDETIYLYQEADIKAMIYHMAKWGNNLNQAATALNYLMTKKYYSNAKVIEILQKVEIHLQRITKAVHYERDVAYELLEQAHIVVRK